MSYSQMELKEIFDRKNGYCFYCRKKLSFKNYAKQGCRGAWEVAHPFPKSAGGSNNWYNKVPACIECNRAVGDRFGLIDNIRRWF